MCQKRIKFIIKELPQVLQGPIRKFFKIVQIPVFGLLKKIESILKKKKKERDYSTSLSWTDCAAAQTFYFLFSPNVVK